MPAWLAKALPYVAAVLLAWAAYSWAYSRGVSHTTAKYELKIAEATAEYERTQRETERTASIQLAAEAAKHAEEQRNAQKTIDSLRADVRASRVRLSIPVASCAANAAGANSAATGEPGAEARAELMPATADDLVSIAADGDAAVRQLNAVIDAYEALRIQFNQRAR